MSPQIKVSEATLEKIKEQFAEELETLELDSLDDLIGQKWFFRTVTYHSVGKVKKRIGQFLVLEKASWVADSGRFMNAIKEGTLDEVEPVGEMLVNIGSIIDAFPWKHSLNLKQK